MVKLVVVFVAAVLLFVGSAQASCKDDQVLGPESDGYQWPSSGHLINGSVWHEWQFYTFYDTQKKIGIALGVGVSDLEHPEKALTSFNAMVYNVGASSVKNYYGTHFPASELRAWTENATWRTPEVEVDVLTPTVYNVKVHTAAEDFVLDARWSQCSYCARQTENFKPLVILDWQSYMPCARVAGSLTVDGALFRIGDGYETRAYHDKNWGSWPSSKFNWIWSQYNEPASGFSVTFGAYQVLNLAKVDYLFLRFNGTRVKLGTLCLDEFNLEVLEWQTEPQTGYKYATKQKWETHGGGWKLEGSLEALPGMAAQNPGGKGLNLIVFEMLSMYTYKLYHEDSLVLTSSGFGFNEWSDLVKN